MLDKGQTRAYGLQQLSLAFSRQHVPQMLGPELHEMNRLLALDDATLWGIVNRPGRSCSGNSTLARFVNFARFRLGAEEFH